jgi:hypothetical protein
VVIGVFEVFIGVFEGFESRSLGVNSISTLPDSRLPTPDFQDSFILSIPPIYGRKASGTITDPSAC